MGNRLDWRRAKTYRGGSVSVRDEADLPPRDFLDRRAANATRRWEKTLITEEVIDDGRSPAGGWTNAQLRSWGVPIPPPRGWRKKLIKLGRWED